MNGVWFDDKHSFSDFGLVLNSRNIPLPEPKTYTIEVPCADGILDLSTALTGGEVKYANRAIDMTFTVMSSGSQLETVKSRIANHLHGKTMNVVFDADSGFFYSGRCKIAEFNTSVNPAIMTISVDADPYKYNSEVTTETVTVSSSASVTIDDQNMKVVPTITVSDDMQLVYKTKNYSLLEGDNIIADVVLSSGSNNVLQFVGNGTATITFRGGEL